MRATLRRPASRADLGWRGVTPKLSALEERELAVRIALGDAEARDRMVRANLGLVVVIAGRFAHLAMPLEDLVSEGNLGLIRAVEAFNPAAGVRFGTYATFWIRQSIRRALMNQADLVRRPAHAHKLLTKWRRAKVALTRRLGREPTPEELGEALGLGPRRRRLAESVLRPADSALDRLAIPGHDPDPAEAAAEAEALERLRQRLGGLCPRESAVLRLRYGLDAEAPMTLQQVSHRLGLSRESVRLAEGRALRRLSAALAGG